MLTHRIRHFLFKWFRPIMVGGFKRADGRILKQTRISNTTFIDAPENLDIEENVFIGHYNFIDASNGLMIGEGCQITNYVSMLTHSSHQAIRLYGKSYSEFPADQKVAYSRKPIIIGAYTFVGPHTVIMPGTKIGKGCIISAFSFVSGDFPDFSVISGNPAKSINDTRKVDKLFIEKYPELKKFYEEWAS